MNLRSRAVLIMAIGMFLTTGISIQAEDSTRGIKIVAEDTSTKEWVDIPLYNKTYAVVIGIDKYLSLSHEQQLDYAVSDAKAVENLLKSKYVFNQVYTLYDEQATKSNILDILLNKLAETTEDDAVFVFFAGHGGEEQTNYGSIGYIVPYDGDFSDMRKVISMTAIRDDISKRIKAKHVFYVMDSCYSGILVATRGNEKETRRDISYLQEIAKEPVRQVLTAGSADQTVLDGGPGGHSVFTGRFIEILNNADDFITANEVSSQVKERVFSDANARGHVQTPKSGELFGLGDFIFMPSVTKQIGSIQDQIAGIESELAALKNAEADAIRNKDEAAQREAERQARIAEAKLEAKKLEEERLNQEKIDREKREKEQQAAKAALKLQQEAEAQRLATLQEEITEKRKMYKSSMISSLEGALSEMQALDQEIKSIREQYREELKNRILAIITEYSQNYGLVKLVKDEFETEAEYQARLVKNSVGSGDDNKAKYEAAISTIRYEYAEQIAPLKAQMEEISKIPYTIYGHDGLNLALGTYDAERECFVISVASTSIERPIHPYQHYLVVSEVSGQAKTIGIKKGDIILKYNGQDVRPMSSWDQLKQTVIAETTTIEVDRGGKILNFKLSKGKIGVNSVADDYLNEIEPGQFVVNGFLYVPREAARQFKQDFLNGFITAELKVLAKTPELSLVTSAFIVNESNEKRYDLFKSEYVNLGNNITYDKANSIYWIAGRLKNLNYKGAVKFLEELKFRDSTGWELPTLEQLKSIRNQSATWRYRFHGKYYYTSTLRKDSSSGSHYQYCPAENRTDSGDGENEGVLGVAETLYLPKYIFFEDRYIEMENNIVFDALNPIVWVMTPSEKRYTYLEAEKYVKQFSASNIKGWRLPTLAEMKKLWDLAIPGIDNRYKKAMSAYYYTSTPRKDSSSGSHYQYCPAENRTDSGDSETEYVICAM